MLVLYVDRITVDPETSEELTQYGKLTFVDLAGSERLKCVLLLPFSSGI